MMNEPLTTSGLNVSLHGICLPFPSFLLTALPVTTAVHEFSVRAEEVENCLDKFTTLPLHQMTNHCVVIYYCYYVFVHDRRLYVRPTGLKKSKNGRLYNAYQLLQC